MQPRVILPCILPLNAAGFRGGEKVPLKDGAIDDAEMQRIYAKEDKEFKNFSCALKLSVTYAANVGGLGTIIGCGPNIVFKGQNEA